MAIHTFMSRIQNWLLVIWNDARTILLQEWWQNRPELFFLVAFGLGVFRTLLGISAYNSSIFKPLTYLALLLFGVKIFLTRYRLRELPVMGLLVLFSSVIWWRSHDNALFILAITLCASRDVPLGKIMRVTLGTVLPTAFLVIVSSLTGLIGDKDFAIQRGTVWLHRYGLGFEHPNMLHAVFLITAVLLIYLEFHRRLYPVLIGVGVANVGLYLLTHSRTGLITVFAVIFLAVLYTMPASHRLSLCLSPLLFVLIVAAQIVLTYAYQKGIPLIVRIDNLLQGRAMQAHYYLITYPARLFGNYIPDLSRTTFHYYLDFGYSRLLLNFGWVTLFLYAYANIHTMIKLGRQDRPEAVLPIMTFGIVGFAENYIYYIFLNISMLFFTALLFDDTLYHNTWVNWLASRASQWKICRTIYSSLCRLLSRWLLTEPALMAE